MKVSYLGSDGVLDSFTDTIPANSRRTYNMGERLAAESGSTAGVLVECLTPGRKVMAERAMYYYSRGAGTVTVGGSMD